MKTHRILAASLVPVMLLASCGKPSETPASTSAKTDFLFESKKFSEFPKSAVVEKIGRIVGSSSVTVSSQGVGRVDAVLVKEGQSVKKGQAIVRLADTVGNYGLRNAQARNGVESVDATFESTKVSLDKAVSDAEIALERAKIDQAKTVADSEKQLEKALRDSEKTSVSLSGSDAQAAIAKAELDLANLKASNAKTIENFVPTYRTTVSDFRKLVNSVIFDSDKLLGISDQNRAYNDAFETYLGARDASLLPRAQNAYAKVLEVSKFLETKSSSDISSDAVLDELSQIEGKYAVVRALLDANVNLMQNSVPAGTLNQAAIDGYVANFNGYKSSLSGLENAFVAFRNSASSFLANYRNNEASAAAGIDLQRKNLASGEFDAKVAYERSKIAIGAGIENANLAVRTAELNLDNAIKNREATLRKLEASRSDAQIALTQSASDLSKLIIVSPIDATVSKVMAQVGQDLGSGTPVVEISSKNPEILLDVDESTARILEVGAGVEVASTNGKSFSGTVIGVSKVASASLLYGVRVSVIGTPDLLGGTATVRISLPTPYPVVPVDAVKILSEQSGELTAYSGGTFVKVPVKLGKLSSGTVEILSEPSGDLDVVTTDVSNFDEKAAAPKRK